MYHRVLPADDARVQFEQPGMIVHPHTFERHLDVIRNNISVVSLSDWLSRAANGEELPDRACAITFDDGWKDNHEFAFPALLRYQVPATIFLVADQIGDTAMLWPERLAKTLSISLSRRDRDEIANGRSFAWLFGEYPHLLERDEIDTSLLDEVIVFAKRTRSDAALQELTLAMAEAVDDPRCRRGSMLNWSQILEMHASGLVEFGSHTCNHVRLNSDAACSVLQHEIVVSKKKLEAGLDAEISLFCFPNGDTSKESIGLVRANYRAAVTTRKGWNYPGTDAMQLKRTGIHQGNSACERMFLARLSGH